VPATRRNLEEGNKNSKVPNLPFENSDDETEKKNRPNEKGLKVPDLKEFFGSLILSRHPHAWGFLQWSNRVVIFRDLSARHRTEIETNFYQIIDPNILPWLVEENYKDSEQVDTNLNSWRDGVQSGLVFSRMVGAKQGEEFGPKPGYVLDNHTKVSQLKFRPLVLLINYIVTPKNVVEFHTTLYSLVHNRFPAPKKAGLQGFSKTDVQNIPEDITLPAGVSVYVPDSVGLGRQDGRRLRNGGCATRVLGSTRTASDRAQNFGRAGLQMDPRPAS
jgi:hypothetical protein